MNILVISPGFLPTIGGAEIGVHEIYSRLGKRHKVTILTQTLKKQAISLGFDQTYYTVLRYRDILNFGRIGGRMLLRGILPPFSLGALMATVHLLRRIKPDVVNVHYAIYTGLAAIWTQKAAHIPTVLSLIGRDSAPGPQVPALWPRYARWIGSQVSFTIFISRFCQSYHKTAGYPNTIIPYGVNTRQFQLDPQDNSLREQLSLKPETQILFTLQRMHSIKRIDLALRAVKLLLDLGTNNFVLLIGGDGPEMEKLSNLATDLHIQENIRWLGFIPENELPRYFALSDIFVFTSAYETFGIVLAQALAAGVPIAAIHNSAIPEIVDDGVNGLLAPEGDLPAFVANLHYLLDNRALRKQMGQEGRKRAEAEFDWDKIANRYETVLQAFANGRTYGENPAALH